MVDLNRRTYLRTMTATLGAATGVASAQSGALDRVAAQTNEDGATDGDAFDQAEPWSQHLVDAANAGAATTQGPRRNLELDWSYTDVEAWGVYRSPALVDGRLYFVSLESDIGDSGRVHAVDARDGSDVWQRETEMRHETTPAVHDGRVFVGDGELLALDAADGAELWRSDAAVLGSVTAADGTVYAATEGEVITAYDAADGTEQWTFDPAADSVDWSTDSPPAVADGTVYGTATVAPDDGDSRSAVFALDAETGERAWFAELSPETSGSGPSPAVADGTVFVDPGDLYALDADDGEVQWSVADTHDPAVRDGTVYAAQHAGSPEHEENAFVALDAETGERLWRTVWDPGAETGARTDLVVANDMLYVGTFVGGLYAFDAATGEELDRALTRGYVNMVAAPTVGGGTAYVATQGSSGDVGLYAVVEGQKSPDSDVEPDVELRTGPDQSFCSGSQVTFIRENSEPSSTVDYEADDYAWKMDFDTSDDESGAYEPMTDTAGELVEHTYDEPGTYEVAVVGKYPDGRTVRDTVTVDIVECEGPIARIETGPADAESRDFALMDEVTFSAEPSEADAGLERYEWDLDGNGDFEERGDSATVVLGEKCREETLTVSLRVGDAEGVTDTASVTVSTIPDDG